ncbi:MAG: hypothetical protein D6808_01985, partial [Candidatus Dadabacteria bacterium]
ESEEVKTIISEIERKIRGLVDDRKVNFLKNEYEREKSFEITIPDPTRDEVERGLKEIDQYINPQKVEKLVKQKCAEIEMKLQKSLEAEPDLEKRKTLIKLIRKFTKYRKVFEHNMYQLREWQQGKRISVRDLKFKKQDKLYKALTRSSVFTENGTGRLLRELQGISTLNLLVANVGKSAVKTKDDISNIVSALKDLGFEGNDLYRQALLITYGINALIASRTLSKMSQEYYRVGAYVYNPQSKKHEILTDQLPAPHEIKRPVLLEDVVEVYRHLGYQGEELTEESGRFFNELVRKYSIVKRQKDEELIKEVGRLKARGAKEVCISKTPQGYSIKDGLKLPSMEELQKDLALRYEIPREALAQLLKEKKLDINDYDTVYELVLAKDLSMWEGVYKNKHIPYLAELALYVKGELQGDAPEVMLARARARAAAEILRTSVNEVLAHRYKEDKVADTIFNLGETLSSIGEGVLFNQVDLSRLFYKAGSKLAGMSPEQAEREYKRMMFKRLESDSMLISGLRKTEQVGNVVGKVAGVAFMAELLCAAGIPALGSSTVAMGIGSSADASLNGEGLLARGIAFGEGAMTNLLTVGFGRLIKVPAGLSRNAFIREGIRDSIAFVAADYVVSFGQIDKEQIMDDGIFGFVMGALGQRMAMRTQKRKVESLHRREILKEVKFERKLEIERNTKIEKNSGIYDSRQNIGETVERPIRGNKLREMNGHKEPSRKKVPDTLEDMERLWKNSEAPKEKISEAKANRRSAEEQNTEGAKTVDRDAGGHVERSGSVEKVSHSKEPNTNAVPDTVEELIKMWENTKPAKGRISEKNTGSNRTDKGTSNGSRQYGSSDGLVDGVQKLDTKKSKPSDHKATDRGGLSKQEENLHKGAGNGGKRVSEGKINEGKAQDMHRRKNNREMENFSENGGTRSGDKDSITRIPDTYAELEASFNRSRRSSPKEPSSRDDIKGNRGGTHPNGGGGTSGNITGQARKRVPSSGFGEPTASPQQGGRVAVLEATQPEIKIEMQAQPSVSRASSGMRARKQVRVDHKKIDPQQRIKVLRLKKRRLNRDILRKRREVFQLETKVKKTSSKADLIEVQRRIIALEKDIVRDRARIKRVDKEVQELRKAKEQKQARVDNRKPEQRRTNRTEILDLDNKKLDNRTTRRTPQNQELEVDFNKTRHINARPRIVEPTKPVMEEDLQRTHHINQLQPAVEENKLYNRETDLSKTSSNRKTSPFAKPTRKPYPDLGDDPMLEDQLAYKLERQKQFENRPKVRTREKTRRNTFRLDLGLGEMTPYPTKVKSHIPKVYDYEDFYYSTERTKKSFKD